MLLDGEKSSIEQVVYSAGLSLSSIVLEISDLLKEALSRRGESRSAALILTGMLFAHGFVIQGRNYRSLLMWCIIIVIGGD